MQNVKTTRLWVYSCFNVILVLLLALWFWNQNKPVHLTEAQLPADGKLQCVSYAPYYAKGQSPFIKGTVISRNQIDGDMELLAKRFNCVRIYSVSQGLDYVPEAASRVGIKVLLGAWIGGEKADNDQEVSLAIKLANAYPQTIRGLIIGNEVLLRKDQTAATLKAYFKQAKAETNVPVTYADVWEYWLKNKDLESSVDFVTVHILPYWEDDPQSVQNAINHTAAVMRNLQQTFTKPLLIGETGWPSVGRQRRDSIPSLLNQAEYMRSFLATAHEKGWDYNLIEAMDQPWKRVLEGTVGGYWGLYTTELQPKFDFSGPVSERHDGERLGIFIGAGIGLFVLLTMFTREKRVPAYFAIGLLGALAGASAYLQLEYLAEACRDSDEWLLLGGITLVGHLLLLSIPFLLTQPSGMAHKLVKLCMWIIAVAVTIGSLLSLPTLQIVNGFGITDRFWTGLLFNIDGRYRDFPLPLYALPVLQLAIGLFILQVDTNNTWNYYKHLSIASILAMVACLTFEINNVSALCWMGLVLAIAFASWPRNKPSRLKTLFS